MGPSDSAIDERTSSRRLEQSYAQEIFVQRLQLVLMSCQVVWTLGVALLFAIFPCRLAGESKGKVNAIETFLLHSCMQ